MKIKIKDKHYKVRHNWNDVTIKDMADIAKIDVEDVIIDQVLNQEYSDEAYIYMKEVISVLSKCGTSELDNFTRIEIEIMFEFVHHIINSMYNLDEISYKPQGLQRIRHKGIWYDIPEPLRFEQDVILAYKEPAKNMTEASNLLTAITDLKIKGFDGMPYLCAIWLKPVEGELYDDKKVIERAKVMQDLPA